MKPIIVTEQPRIQSKRVNAKFDLNSYKQLRVIQDWLREEKGDPSLTLIDALKFCVKYIHNEKININNNAATGQH